MANIFRAPYRIDHYRRAYLQVDPVPNIAAKLSALPPFIQREGVPQRVEPRKWVQDFQQPNFQTQGIPVRARDPNIFRAPLFVPIFGRPVLQPDLVPNALPTLLKLVSPNPPFTLEQFPEIFRRNIGDMLGFDCQAFLPGPASLPFFPAEFPTPMRARATPQDFFFPTTSIPPAAPFNQDDWQNTIKARPVHQDFIWNGNTTRGIPAGVIEPYNLQDWPLPTRLKLAQADSYASPNILLITPVLRPFAQTDFPNPSPTRRLRTDWLWSGATTRGIPPVPPPSGPFAAVYLEGYWNNLGSLTLVWSASLGVAGYRLYINGVAQPQILTQRFITVTGLAIDTSYVFNIVCVNAFGVDASILSNPVYFEHGSSETGTYHTKPWN